MSWVEAPAASYSFKYGNSKMTSCQVEITLPWYALKPYACDGQWAKIAPLRILSFDIECAGRKGIFPQPREDPVIQLANIVTRHGKTFIRFMIQSLTGFRRGSAIHS